jgi:hypothetical protein
MEETEDMKQDSGKNRKDGGPDKSRLSIRTTGENGLRKDEDTDPSRTLIPLYHARTHTHSPVPGHSLHINCNENLKPCTEQ